MLTFALTLLTMYLAFRYFVVVTLLKITLLVLIATLVINAMPKAIDLFKRIKK